jgi:hypothetical protein
VGRSTAAGHVFLWLRLLHKFSAVCCVECCMPGDNILNVLAVPIQMSHNGTVY